MKHSGIYIIFFLFLGFSFQACSEKDKPKPTPVINDFSDTTDYIAPEPHVDEIASIASFQLPKLLMPGVLDPPPVDITDSTAKAPLLAVSNLGRFASVGEMRKSYFYPQFCSLYPELENISRITVDTGVGDLWLFEPLEPNCSLAINEYNMKMFMQEQEEGDGEVYLRTESARPVLVKASMDDPGSLVINMMSNEGQTLHWIPVQSPSDNVLRDEEGVVVLTYNPIESFVEMGADYTASVNGEMEQLRFYADRQVRVNNRLMRYVSFHTDDLKIGLYIKGIDFEAYFEVDKIKAEPESFSLTTKQGYDFGIGYNKTITFRK